MPLPALAALIPWITSALGSIGAGTAAAGAGTAAAAPAAAGLASSTLPSIMGPGLASTAAVPLSQAPSVASIMGPPASLAAPLSMGDKLAGIGKAFVQDPGALINSDVGKDIAKNAYYGSKLYEAVSPKQQGSVRPHTMSVSAYTPPATNKRDQERMLIQQQILAPLYGGRS